MIPLDRVETAHGATNAAETDAVETNVVEIDVVEIAHGATNAAETGAVETGAAEIDVVETGAVETDVVEIAHGETNAAETGAAEIDVVETNVVEIKNREMGIGNASPVKIATLPSGPNVTDAVATKTVQEAIVPQVGHLGRLISVIISELEIAKEAGASLETEVEETAEAEVPAAHSETDVVVDSTHKVMNRFACIGTTEA